jgi:diadenosine tetraphosphatase ApaH/serine/threonine PP2A family protein phosphatase
MKYAIFSDVHANIPALEAVLGHAPADATLLHVGDLVGYGPQPNEVLERLAHVAGVRGNHDEAMLVSDERFDALDFHAAAAYSAVWTRERLSPASLAYLAALPYTLTVEDPDLAFTLAHGSPCEPEAFRYILSNDDAMRATKYFRTQVCFVGHSHLPGSFGRPGGTGRILAQRNGRPAGGANLLDIEDGVQYVVNVGSVGQPRDRDPRACYVVFDTSARTIAWQRVPYDAASVRAMIESNDLPLYFGDRLLEGR